MKVIELALNAGRRRQSEVTGFVHLCYENPDHHRETIPVYENFCFALALLRSRTAENILEARALLEKLLAFEVGGGFPVYLHEFPLCRFEGLEERLYPVIFYILRDFQTVLGDRLREKLQAFSRPPKNLPEHPQTPAAWGRFLIQAQMQEGDITPALRYWDAQCLAFCGAQQQERGEPAVTLFDLFMGQWGGKFSARALDDHPVHLQASLIFPGSFTDASPSHTLTHCYWGDGHPTHSLVFQTTGSYLEEEGKIRVTLPEIAVEEEIEISFFCNLHPDTQIFANGKKATAFHLGDSLSLISKNRHIELSFHHETGEGSFWGHLSRGNRPGQLCCRGEEKHEAYDQIIGLRTVKRAPACSITINVLHRFL